MKKVQLAQVNPYAAPKHFGMVALKLHGKEETGSQKFWVGLSHFLPGGGAEYDESPTEKVYFVLDGEITVKTRRKRLSSAHGIQFISLPTKVGRSSTRPISR